MSHELAEGPSPVSTPESLSPGIPVRYTPTAGSWFAASLPEGGYTYLHLQV